MFDRILVLLTTTLLFSALFLGYAVQLVGAVPAPSPGLSGRSLNKRTAAERELEARAIADLTNARRLAEGLPLAPPVRRGTRTSKSFVIRDYARQNGRGGVPSPVPIVNPERRRRPEA
ncbi:unnamed protein product [Cyclocybe aegerita]|uniref:Uncharacterized protein n=1 Tax=Cyclocybe aegerita TaxID=1973307 RepID=A0A8S0W7U8_CYCAE|nr:unnamed protein product [Cyclocybe aegerita]